jgi:succinate-semialdehyde dehydrogenase/glutarate-semialdehyde dehydrogenase
MGPTVVAAVMTVDESAESVRRTGGQNATDRPALPAGLVDLATTTGEEGSMSVEEPYTGEELGEVPACGEAAVDLAVERARDAQETWADRPVDERAAVLERFHDRLLDRQDELLDVVQLETGKARRHAYDEVMSVAVTARHYAVRAPGYLESERRRGAFPLLTRTDVHHDPKGVVGLIAPWNYPFELVVSDAIPALLAGNAVVCKPAEQTTHVALYAKRLLDEAGLPEDVFQIVPGEGSEVGPPLIERVDHVGFTGSTAVGREVAAQAGEHLTSCSLELGGKNPAVVRADADLDRAVRGLVRGCFDNAGQTCIAIERIYVHESIYDEFVRRFADAARDRRPAATYDFGPELGSLVSAEQLERVESHVEDARVDGATIRTGGRARPDVGPYFYEPTVLTDVEEEMDVCCEETFGPVVSVHPVVDDEEAVARANDSEYGLNASVWTEDEERGRELARRIEAGTVNVNEAYVAAYASVDAPMGGTKDSGIGRRHGEEGFYKYTESKTVATQRADAFSEPPVPFGAFTRVMTAVLKVWRRIPGLR